MPLILLAAVGLARADGTLDGYVWRGVEPATDVVLHLVGPDAVAASPIARDVPVGPDGSFRVALPAGTWTVTLPAGTADGSATTATVTIADGAESELLVTLDPAGGPPLVTVESARAADAPVVVEGPKGWIEGVVRGEDGAPLAGVRVYVRGQPGEARTGADGRYRVEAAAGEHELSFVLAGFGTRTVAGLATHAEPGDTSDTSADVSLVAVGLSLADVTVTAPRIEGGTATLLAERQEAATVNDVLGAEQMARAGDSDAASALKRVAGLTVVGGKYVYVRGLGDRYSATLLNGSTLPSPEPEKRVVPLDLFPTALLEGVVIQKTFSPDRPAEFGGGIVGVRTRGLPEETLLSVGASAGYASGTTFTEGEDLERGPTDWLGFGAAVRALPQPIADSGEPLKAGGMFTENGFSGEELQAFGLLFADRWSTHPRLLPPDVGLTANGGSRWSLGGVDVGFLAGLVWSNGWGTDDGEQRVFSYTGEDITLKRSTLYSATDNTIRLGASLTAGVQWGDGQKILSTTLLNRNSRAEVLHYQASDPSGSGDTRTTRLTWEEQQLLFEQLAADVNLGPLRVEGRYAYSLATRDEPDRREYTYIGSADGWFVSQRGAWNELLWTELDDENHDVGLDVTLPIHPEAERHPELKAGAVTVQRTRSAGTRRFSYEFHGSEGMDLSAPIDAIITDETIGAQEDGDAGYLEIEEYTANSDDYVARQQLYAGYAQADVPWLPRLRTLFGARVEASKQSVSTFELYDADKEPVAAELSSLDVLPAALVTLGVGRDEPDAMLLRAGYGRTVSRPELRELSQVPYYDYKTGRIFYGNPDLERATIDNVDLRWEWYPRAGDSLSVGAFYKAFHQPIEAVVEVSAVSGSAGTFANAAGATNLGMEVDGRTSLDVLHPALADLSVAGNVSVIYSRVDLSESGGNQTSDERPLQGQSPWVLNASLAYDNPDTRTGVSLLYNVYGPRISQVGTSGIPDTYELPRHRVDAVVSQGFGDHWKLTVKGRNLLDWPAREKTGDEIADETREGWGASIGLTWKL